jgi:hypothetical protein
MLPVPTEYSAYLACPVRAHRKPFTELEELLSLPPGTAKLLDDVRALTVAITDASSQDDSSSSREKIQRIASSIHKGVGPVSDEEETTDLSDDDRIIQIIRLAAAIYTEAVTKLAPLTSIKSTYDAEKTLEKNIRAVTQIRWKKMPGVFLWIMLVAVVQTTSETVGEFDVGSEEEGRKKWLRRKLGAAAQAVGQEEFGLSIAYLRAFWLVYRWIERERKDRDEETAEVAPGSTDPGRTPSPEVT